MLKSLKGDSVFVVSIQSIRVCIEAKPLYGKTVVGVLELCVLLCSVFSLKAQYNASQGLGMPEFNWSKRPLPN